LQRKWDQMTVTIFVIYIVVLGLLVYGFKKGTKWLTEKESFSRKDKVVLGVIATAVFIGLLSFILKADPIKAGSAIAAMLLSSVAVAKK